MKKDNSLQLIIEGALMASQDPLTLQDIANLFDENKPSKNQIKLVKFIAFLETLVLIQLQQMLI